MIYFNVLPSNDLSALLTDVFKIHHPDIKVLRISFRQFYHLFLIGSGIGSEVFYFDVVLNEVIKASLKCFFLLVTCRCVTIAVFNVYRYAPDKCDAWMVSFAMFVGVLRIKSAT